MHLLIQFFDYLLCDGSHGFSKYGWKFVPIVILTSGGWTVPMGSVFGLEEDSESLNALIALFREHCERHGVRCHHFNLREKPDAGMSVHPDNFEFDLSVHCDRCSTPRNPKRRSQLDKDELADLYVSSRMGTFHVCASESKSNR